MALTWSDAMGLVCVGLPMCIADSASANFATSGHYYCHFYAQHPDDASVPDPTSRWWPLWHRYTHGADNVMDFHERVLFNPTTVPNPRTHIAWADVLPLLDPFVCLLGPFLFSDLSTNPPGRTSSFRQLLAPSLWESLATLCVHRGILPPVLTSCQVSIPSPWSRTRRAADR
jgi:hypothetical protein